MKRIVFQNSLDALNPNDYNIENCYQENKDREVIYIANALLLNRFRLGVKRKEIESFELVVEDIGHKDIYNDICKENGNLCEAWDAKILNVNLELMMELI